MSRIMNDAQLQPLMTMQFAGKTVDQVWFRRADVVRIVSDAIAILARTQPEGAKTGWPPGMLQDDSRDLSRALAGMPHARAHADEAAVAILEERERADLRRRLAILATFAHEIMVGAIDPDMQVGTAKNVLRVTRLSLLDDLMALNEPEDIRTDVPEALYAVSNDRIDWRLVGVLIEAHMSAARHHSPGTSNWGAWLYKALVSATREATPATNDKEPSQ